MARAESNPAAAAYEPIEFVLEITRVERPADPFAFRFEPQAYTLRTGGGGRAEFRVAWGPELLADLAAVRAPGRDPALLQRLGELLRGYMQGFDWPGLSRALADAEAAGGAVRIAIRANAAEIYALPWELLALPSGQLLGRLPQAWLRYEWPETTTCPEGQGPRGEGGRILLAWSAAGGAVPADRHLAAIRDACARGHPRGERGLASLAHASAAGLVAALTAGEQAGEPFAALHLLCHGAAAGSGFGLVLDGDAGPMVVDAGTLRDLLARFAGSLRLVVLAACDGGNAGAAGNYLGSVAQALHRARLSAVIAARYPLSVDGSVVLTRVLYEHMLPATASIERSFAAARAALALRPAELDWAALQLHARADAGGETAVVFRPFRGLYAFTAAHGRFFHGRAAERAAIVERLAAQVRSGRPRLLVVAGASGSGKSSVVLAGTVLDLTGATDALDPALRPAAPWQVRVVRPGAAPLAALAQALDGRTPGPLLLIVDQFEELFTHRDDAGARQAFARRLWAAASGPGEVHCVVTLRVDFIGRCGELVLDDAGLRLDRVAYDERHRVFVAQMTADQLREAIVGPSARVGLRLQDGLVERLLVELGDEPGALPVLQHTLDLLWQRRADRTLTIAAYEALGGVFGALQSQADALIDALPADALAQAHRLLTRLVGVSDDAAAPTRRRLPLVAPVGPAGPAFARALSELVAARLLVVAEAEGHATVEVAHEALIRKWPRLRRWVREDREKLGELAKLEQWATSHREHGALLSGAQLGYAEEVERRYPDDLDPGARALLAASRGRRAREQRRRRLGLVALAGLALLFAALSWWALDRARAAEDEQRRAAASEVAARDAAAVAGSRRLAGLVTGATNRQTHDLLLAIEAARVVDGRGLDMPPDVGVTLTRLVDRAWPSQRLVGQTAPFFAPDGRLITSDAAHGLTLWAVTDAGPPTPVRTEAGVEAARISPDGRWLVGAGLRGVGLRLWRLDGDAPPVVYAGRGALPQRPFSPDGGSLLVLDRRYDEIGANVATTARVLRTADAATTLELAGHADTVADAAFSPDGRWLATASMDATVRLLAADGGGQARVLRRDAPVNQVTFSADGARLLAHGGKLVDVWSVTGDAHHRRAFASWIAACRWRPDGTSVVIALGAGAPQVWRVDADAEPTELKFPEGKTATDVAYSPDGRWIVVAGQDGAVRIYDADAQGAPVRTLVGHQGYVDSAAFSPDGGAVVSAAQDRSLRLWPLRAREPWDVLDARPTLWRLSPDGARLARGVMTDAQLTLEVWTTRGAAAPIAVLPPVDADSELAFSPDGSLLAVAGRDGSLVTWRTDGSGARADFPGHRDAVYSVGFSADGRRMVSASADRTVRIWPLDRVGAPVVLVGHVEAVDGAAFLADGRRVVSHSFLDGTIRVWPADGAGEPVTLHGVAIGRDVAVSPDGRLLASRGAEDRDVALHRTDGVGAPVVLVGHSERLLDAAFSPDGQTLVTGAADGTARVWSLAGEPREVAVASHQGAVEFVAFSPDGRRIVTSSQDQSTRIWRADGGGPSLAFATFTDRITFLSDDRVLLGDPPRLWPLEPSPLLQRACALVDRNLTRGEWSLALPGEPYRQTCPERPAAPTR